jgi:hypothetical protein
LAALAYWRDEMLPHGRRIMLFYFPRIGSRPITPLNRSEIAQLAQRLHSLLKRPR